MPTHYQTLNLPPTATPSEIRKAHRTLILRHHPDKQPQTLSPSDPAQATARFQQIQEAYETLSDAERRAAYDTQQGFAQPRQETVPLYGARYPPPRSPQPQTPHPHPQNQVPAFFYHVTTQPYRHASSPSKHSATALDIHLHPLEWRTAQLEADTLACSLASPQLLSIACGLEAGALLQGYYEMQIEMLLKALAIRGVVGKREEEWRRVVAEERWRAGEEVRRRERAEGVVEGLWREEQEGRRREFDGVGRVGERLRGRVEEKTFGFG